MILIDPHDALIEAEALLTAAEQGTLAEIPTAQYVDALQVKWDEGTLSGYSFWCTLVLLARHRPAFPDDTQARLTRLALALCQHARPVRAARHFYAVRSYLEALVVLRLLAQEDIEQDFEDAVHEWIFFEWGCGAHLSNTPELLYLLGLLLTLDTQPPRQTEMLFRRLVKLEEDLANPVLKTLRQSLSEAEGALWSLLARLGLQNHLLPQTSPPNTLTIPCFGGAVFRQHRSSHGTLATLSRYPFAPSTPQNLLCLDTVSCQTNTENRGCFSEGEVLKSVTLQRGAEALALRFYDHRPSTAQDVQDVQDGWEQFEEGGIGISPRCLSGHEPIQERRGGHWVLAARLEAPCLFVVLWAISLEGEIEGVPLVTPARVVPSVPRRKGEEAWDIDWELPGGLWKVRVDPLAKEPLCGR
nr:hypothetical protein [Armatimonas sp.]